MAVLYVRLSAAWLLKGCRRSHRCVSSRGITSSTVDRDEVTRFNRLASGWWDSTNILHTMNGLRVPLIRDAMVRQRAAPSKNHQEAMDSATPLKGMTILDVGCGGGILCEPLARLGAEVTGIDASADLIQVAKWHAELDTSIGSRVTYKILTIEDLCKSNVADESVQCYDGVVASEIVEHVSDVELFLNACCSLVKPGGSIFFTTINRTLCSYAASIVLAEYVLRVVPRGVHDWNKFISPEDLQRLITRNGCTTRLIHGMTLNPLTLNWSWISNTSVNYALHAVKSIDHSTES